MVAFDGLIKNYSCFNVNNQSCLHGLFLPPLVLIGYLFLKNLHDRTQITQAGELQAQKSPRGEGWGCLIDFTT